MDWVLEVTCALVDFAGGRWLGVDPVGCSSSKWAAEGVSQSAQGAGGWSVRAEYQRQPCWRSDCHHDLRWLPGNGWVNL